MRLKLQILKCQSGEETGQLNSIPVLCDCAQTKPFEKILLVIGNGGTLWDWQDSETQSIFPSFLLWFSF